MNAVLRADATRTRGRRRPSYAALPQLVACFVETRVALRERTRRGLRAANHQAPRLTLLSGDKRRGEGARQCWLACARQFHFRRFSAPMPRLPAPPLPLAEEVG